MSVRRFCSQLVAVATLLASAAFVDGCSAKPQQQQQKPECMTNADCTNGQICTANKCGPCSRDRDCARNEFCQPVDRRCELMPCFGNDCKLNDECKLGQFCVQGLCVTPPPPNTPVGPDTCTVVTCTKNADCNMDQLCDPANNVCIKNLGCSTDADCGPMQACNTGSGQCVTACTKDNAATVCGITQVCTNGRCVDCQQDSDCGVGLTCDQTTNTCVAPNSCMTDRDCTVPLICNALTHACTVQPPECLSMEDCPMGQTCETQTGRCIPGVCMPDRFEPNETLEQAAAVPIDTIPNLTLCQTMTQSPIAYFKVPLNSGDRLDVYVDVDTLLNFDIAILDPTGTVLSEAAFATEAVAPVAGTYYIRAQSSDQYVAYGLRLSVTHGTACASNDVNKTYDRATPEQQGDLYGVQLCPSDVNWYVVQAARGQTVTAELDSTPTDGVIDISLYDSNGTSLLIGSTSAQPKQTVSTNMFTGSRVYIKVYGDTQAVQNTYDLHLRIQ